MNYLKRKLLGHVFMCADGGGGGSDANYESGTTDLGDGLSAGTYGGGTSASPGLSAGGFGAVGGTPSTEGAPTTLAPLEQVSIDPNAGKVANVSTNTPAYNIGGKPSPTIDFQVPTLGGIVAGATNSKTAGGLANLAANATPLGPLNAIGGLVNMGIGAVNEMTANPEPKPGDVVSTDTVTGGTSDTNVASDGGSAGGQQGGTQSNDTPAGIIGSVTSPAPATPPATAAAPDVNYNLFGSLGLGGWSSAAKKFAAKKGVVTI